MLVCIRTMLVCMWIKVVSIWNMKNIKELQNQYFINHLCTIHLASKRPYGYQGIGYHSSATFQKRAPHLATRKTGYCLAGPVQRLVSMGNIARADHKFDLYGPDNDPKYIYF